jgi:hypothetical protein
MAEDHDLAGDVRHLLATLIRASLLTDDEKVAATRRDALHLYEQLRAKATPEGLARLRLDGLWTAGIHEAETPAFQQEPLRVSLQFPSACPLTLSDLVEPGIALPAIEQRIRDSAATG